MTQSTSSFRVIRSALGVIVSIFVGFPAFSQNNEEACKPAEVTIEQLQICVAELSSHLAKVESSLSKAELFDWLTLLVAILVAPCAALFGAWLGGRLSKSAAVQAENRALNLRKKEATISICAHWIEITESIASTFLILEKANSKIEENELNEISAYGNWLEMVLLMKADDMLDESFFDKFNFQSRVVNFRDKVKAAQKANSSLGDYLSNWAQISKI